MAREEIIRKFEEQKILLISRGIYDEELLKLVDTLHKGGISLFEITYNQADPDSMKIIRKNVEMLVSHFGGEVSFGTGTVLTVEQVRNTKAAGAEFIVSPNCDQEIIRETVAQDMVSIPGCMTPTEIVAADKAGADFIKLFPAGTLGMKYCRNIYAPLNHVRYLATGGVNEESFREYLEMGFAGAGISSKLVDKTLRAEGRWDELEERARRFVAIAREYNR